MTPADGAPAVEGASFADRAFAVTAEAYADTAGGWELSIQAAIAALFDFLAERPGETNACVLADREGSGRDTLAHRDRTIERFVELLRPGFAAAPMPPPPVVGDAIGGGIYALVRCHVLERRRDELPAAASDAAFVALSPFMGAERAQR